MKKLVILLKGGNFIPIPISDEKLKELLPLLMYASGKVGVEGIFSVFISEIQGYYVSEITIDPAQKIANAMEKHLGEGENWK